MVARIPETANVAPVIRNDNDSEPESKGPWNFSDEESDERDPFELALKLPAGTSTWQLVVGRTNSSPRHTACITAKNSTRFRWIIGIASEMVGPLPDRKRIRLQRVF